MRYHSLTVPQPVPDSLRVTAWTEDNVVMGARASRAAALLRTVPSRIDRNRVWRTASAEFHSNTAGKARISRRQTDAIRATFGKLENFFAPTGNLSLLGRHILRIVRQGVSGILAGFERRRVPAIALFVHGYWNTDSGRTCLRLSEKRAARPLLPRTRTAFRFQRGIRRLSRIRVEGRLRRSRGAPSRLIRIRA